MTENEVSYIIRGCIFNVYNTVGPGLLESAYEVALIHELNLAGLSVQSQVGLPMMYKSVKMSIGYRIDMIIQDKVIIEIKSVENLMDVHHKQLITYLKLSGLKLGILVNFNTDRISDNIIRKVNML